MSSLDHNTFDIATPVLPSARRRKGESWEYRVYFTMIFCASLPIALIRVLLPNRSRAFGIARERRGVWGEAKMMANIITPLIFSV